MFDSILTQRGAAALRTAVWSSVTALALGLTACEDDDDVTAVVITQPITAGAVTTFVDTMFNFQTLRTFAMPDTVIHFAPATGTPLPVSREFDRTILDRVRQDFLGRGYILDTDPANVAPDFVVLVGTTATENYMPWVSYSWYATWGFYAGWGFYVPGFDASWGIVYPYATVGVTPFSRGTLIVDLIPTLSVNPLAKEHQARRGPALPLACSMARSPRPR